MTYPISDVTRRVVYSGSLGTGPYPFSFEILVAGDIGVYKNTTLLTLSADYTVTINADGTGSVTLTSAATSSDTISIFGNKGIQRQTDFTTGGDLFANSLNDELDAQTIFAQQNSEAILRSIRAPVTDPTTIDMVLPAKADRADTVLTFDVDGNPSATSSSAFVAGLSGAIVGANYITNNATGDGSTTAFTVSVAPGSKTNIQIYIDGVYQNKASFSVSGTTVTFTEAPPLNSSIEFMIGYAIGSTSGDATGIDFTQQGTGAVTTTVAQKLWETVSVKDFGYTVENVANMKLCGLVAGVTYTTQGYYTAGDGGQATYLIKTAADYGATPDEYGDHTLANGNVAVLQTEGSANIKQFGVTSTGADSNKNAFLAYLASKGTNFQTYKNNPISMGLPDVGVQNKILMQDNVSGDIYLISKKAIGTGYVATLIDNAGSAAVGDVGGDSPYRTSEVKNLSIVMCGQFTEESKTAGVTTSTLTTAQAEKVFGIPSAYVGFSGSTLYRNAGGGTISLNNPQCWVLGNTQEIVYKIRKTPSWPSSLAVDSETLANNTAYIRFGLTNTTSPVTEIYVSNNNTDWVLYDTVALNHPPSGSVEGRDYAVTYDGDSDWYIKIVNVSAGAPTYVAGINVGFLKGDTPYSIDNVKAYIRGDIDGASSNYRTAGANEFACHGGSSDLYFGTIHGGHSNFFERLRDGVNSYDINAGLSNIPTLHMITSCTLHTSSNLTYDGAVYRYTADTQLGDGSEVVQFNLKLESGDPIMCDTIYTHMCTTNLNFDFVHSPLRLQKTDDGVLALGNCSSIYQHRSNGNTGIITYFSMFDDIKEDENVYGGARIVFSASHNKQYYGPAIISDQEIPLTDFSAFTAKKYV